MGFYFLARIKHTVLLPKTFNMIKNNEFHMNYSFAILDIKSRDLTVTCLIFCKLKACTLFHKLAPYSIISKIGNLFSLNIQNARKIPIKFKEQFRLEYRHILIFLLIMCYFSWRATNTSLEKSLHILNSHN